MWWCIWMYGEGAGNTVLALRLGRRCRVGHGTSCGPAERRGKRASFLDLYKHCHRSHRWACSSLLETDLPLNRITGFHHLYGEGAIYEVACCAHALTQVLRGPYRARFAKNVTSHRPHRRHYAIEAEIRGSTPEIRKTIRQAQSKASARQTAHLARSDVRYALVKVRHRCCDPPRALALAGVHPLCRRWPARYGTDLGVRFLLSRGESL